MELIYLYIEEFRDIIKNWEITFSPEYKITKTDNHIEVEKLENKSLEGFFGPNILNVTAFVGPNGSGKTTLCEYLFSYALGNMYAQTIFILKEQNRLKLYYNREMGDIRWSESELPVAFSGTGDRLDLGLVYFSSTVGNMSFLSYSNAKIPSNISNSFLVSNPPDSMFGADDNYTKFRYSDLEKQVKFLDRTSINLGFDVDFIGFYFNDHRKDIPNETRYSSSNFGKYIFGRIEHELSSKIDNIRPGHQLQIKNDDSKMALLMLCMFWEMRNNTEMESFLNEALSCDNMVAVEEVISRRREKETNLNQGISSIHNYYEYLKEAVHAMRAFSVNVFLFRSAIDIIEQLQFNLNRSQVLRFMELSGATSTEDYWGHAWGVSAGEYAALSLFSRIWHLKDKFEELKSKTILLILDEADTYLHPDWARKWNKQIFDFLEKDFPEFKFQIVFTTHSPFTLSDIPDTNVIYLEEGATELEQKKTFAENINVLLSDSFYVKGAFIGEFAKKKVQELVSYLETGRCDDPYINSRERALQVVEMIGEPVISWHLQELLSKKGDL